MKQNDEIATQNLIPFPEIVSPLATRRGQNDGFTQPFDVRHSALPWQIFTQNRYCIAFSSGVLGPPAVAQVAPVACAGNVGGALRPSLQQQPQRRRALRLLLGRRGRRPPRQRARHGGGRRQGWRIRAARRHQSGPG